MIAILPGMYAGASLGWKISVPMMLPTLKVARVIAFIVFYTVCEWREHREIDKKGVLPS